MGKPVGEADSHRCRAAWARGKARRFGSLWVCLEFLVEGVGERGRARGGACGWWVSVGEEGELVFQLRCRSSHVLPVKQCANQQWSSRTQISPEQTPHPQKRSLFLFFLLSLCDCLSPSCSISQALVALFYY